MYCRVLACDFDGTGASNGQLAPEVAAALAAARAQGLVTLLVTGRVLEEIEALCPDLSMFDAIVAENGAVVSLPGQRRLVRLGEPPAPELLAELRERGIAFQTGAVIVATWDSHATDVLDAIRRLAIDGQLTFNRSAMMLLPSAINKAVGTERALEELGRSARNLVAFGDAENDLSLFAAAEVSVAARGALPAVAARADEQLRLPGGAGVADYVHRLLERGSVLPTPARHQIAIGGSADGRVTALPASGVNVMISGDPRSGKSWLVGLVAEQLIERGYRLCVIDPEGDCAAIGERPRVMTLGNDLSLPEPSAIPRVLRDEPLSLILSLARLSQQEQTAYVEVLLCELQRCCERTGLPHWILVDEAQYFFHGTATCGARFGDPANFLFATYRPSLVSDAVFAAVGAHIITRTEVEEERYFISSLFRARGPTDLVASDALAQLDLGHAGLLVADPVAPRWEVFTPGVRLTPHAHHARKYADARLPEDKAFRFLNANGRVPVVAHNVAEFYRAVQSLPLASLRHHLKAGDFSRWVTDVLGDELLARGLRKIERATAAGANPDRAEILAHIEDQYRIGGE